VKYLFGLLSLVVVLAIVAAVMKTQGRATAGATSSLAPVGGVGASTVDPTTSGNARRLEQLARERTTQALQQGADRNARAEP